MKIEFRKTIPTSLTTLILVRAFLGDAAAQVAGETEREAARLGRLATNVWEGVQDDIRLGYSIDQQTQVDVFNFTNGTRYLSRTVESRW